MTAKPEAAREVYPLTDAAQDRYLDHLYNCRDCFAAYGTPCPEGASLLLRWQQLETQAMRRQLGLIGP